MPYNEIKKQLDVLKERIRRLLAPKDVQKKKGALPPKTHFSIWYFLMAFLLITYLQQ